MEEEEREEEGGPREKDAQGRDEYGAKEGWTSSTFLNVRCS